MAMASMAQNPSTGRKELDRERKRTSPSGRPWPVPGSGRRPSRTTPSLAGRFEARSTILSRPPARK